MCHTIWTKVSISPTSHKGRISHLLVEAQESILMRGYLKKTNSGPLGIFLPGYLGRWTIQSTLPLLGKDVVAALLAQTINFKSHNWREHLGNLGEVIMDLNDFQQSKIYCKGEHKSSVMHGYNIKYFLVISLQKRFRCLSVNPAMLSRYSIRKRHPET